MVSCRAVSCLSGSLSAAAHLTANCVHAVKLSGNDAPYAASGKAYHQAKQGTVCMSALAAVVT